MFVMITMKTSYRSYFFKVEQCKLQIVYCNNVKRNKMTLFHWIINKTKRFYLFIHLVACVLLKHLMAFANFFGMVRIFMLVVAFYIGGQMWSCFEWNRYVGHKDTINNNRVYIVLQYTSSDANTIEMYIV